MNAAVATAVVVSTAAPQPMGPALWFLIMVLLMPALFFFLSEYPEVPARYPFAAYIIFGIVLLIALASIDFTPPAEPPPPMMGEHGKLKVFLVLGAMVIFVSMLSLVRGEKK